MEVVVLHPLTEAEKERRPGRFLAALLAGDLGGRNRAATADSRPLVERLLEGGYPEPVSRSPLRVRQWRRSYLTQILERDVREMSRMRRPADPARLLELPAERTATLLNVKGLANTLAISRETVSHYLEVLERMFLIRRLPSWNRTASKRFVRTPKVHLTDTGLAATLAGQTSADRLGDRGAMGGCSSPSSFNSSSPGRPGRIPSFGSGTTGTGTGDGNHPPSCTTPFAPFSGGADLEVGVPCPTRPGIPDCDVPERYRTPRRLLRVMQDKARNPVEVPAVSGRQHHRTSHGSRCDQRVGKADAGRPANPTRPLGDLTIHRLFNQRGQKGRSLPDSASSREQLGAGDYGVVKPVATRP